jgi:hypothetical protein
MKSTKHALMKSYFFYFPRCPNPLISGKSGRKRGLDRHHEREASHEKSGEPCVYILAPHVGPMTIVSGNYSAAIHQDGEKPVLFVPYFFRALLGFLLNWQKQRPEGLKPFASFSAKSLRISHPKKR